ncbi:hypothetical protein KK2020170_09000 [Flavobacterium okayamense]|uniref:Uncharacterized protein n=1 Tax=Flavobacterium okayamense TaxID=2830782 RepID=A0ABN6HX61_9FLAO|nr:hypothetical protein KK2020170_09000 [Flavobacterium okayamense]
MKYFQIIRAVLFLGSTGLLSIIFLLQDNDFIFKSLVKAFIIAIVIVYVLPTLFNSIKE